MIKKMKVVKIVLITLLLVVVFLSCRYVYYNHGANVSIVKEIGENNNSVNDIKAVDPVVEKEIKDLEKFTPVEINKDLSKEFYLTGVAQYPKLTWNTIAIKHDESRVGLNIEYPKFNGGVIVSNLNKYISDKVKSIIETSKIHAIDLIRASPDDIGSSLQLSISYKIIGVTKGIVSIAIEVTDSTGGGNGNNSSPLTVNWDLKSDRPLNNQELFCSKDYISTLMPLVRKQIISDFSSSNNVIQPLSQTDIDLVNSGTENKEDNWGNILISKDGLFVVFRPYQVASGAVGNVEVLLPFKDISGVVCLP